MLILRRLHFQEWAVPVEKSLPGYHVSPIEKGVVGEPSKLKEEVDELLDAWQQGVRIMALVELSDLYGAMEMLLQKHFPDTQMKDLAAMAAVTRRAFENGHRVAR